MVIVVVVVAVVYCLGQCGLTLETYGGMTQSVEISALTGANAHHNVSSFHNHLMSFSHSAAAGAGCTELAAAVLLQAELASVSAAADAPADGTVIESRLDKGLGPVFVTIIRDGERKL